MPNDGQPLYVFKLSDVERQRKILKEIIKDNQEDIMNPYVCLVNDYRVNKTDI